MLRKDSPDLPDDERVGLAEMAAVDQELRARAIEVRAGVGHDPVGPACEGRIAVVGDDRVVRSPGSMPNATNAWSSGCSQAN